MRAIQMLADQDVYEFPTEGEVLKFKYRKITNAQFNELEEMKLTLEDQKMKEPVNLRETSKMYTGILKKSAEYYFGINGEYDRISIEDLGFALEAAAYRTLYGKPFLSKSSLTLPDLTEKSPTFLSQPPK